MIATATLLLVSEARSVVAPALTVDFKADDIGKFPSMWHAREDKKPASHMVRAEGERLFLHVESINNADPVGHELSANPNRTPWLRFAWRALGLPPGGDERGKTTNDSALGIYVFLESWGLPPKTIKYVWSSTLPRGTTTESPFFSRVKIVVLRCGAAMAERWVEEEVNILEDYRRLFREEVVPNIIGIGVLTDSNDTGTRAAGDYGSFVFMADHTAGDISVNVDPDCGHRHCEDLRGVISASTSSGWTPGCYPSPPLRRAGSTSRYGR